MTATHPLDLIVVGAGLTGLTSALLLARDGHRVTVIERDPSPPPAGPDTAWTSWRRPGVNQFRQPHLFLPRWRQEMERELPQVLVEMSADGASRVNMLHLQPESVTHGWRPGDEAFDTVTARRPVVEAALSRLAESERAITVRRGVRLEGLLTAPTTSAVPHVVGVATSDGSIPADLVIDAAGRRTPLPALVRLLGGALPVETREPCGFIYYSRHFRSADGRQPSGHGPALTHHPSLSVLTLPCDRGTYCVGLIVSARDKRLRALRHPDVWCDVAGISPVAAAWVARGEPITDVMPIAGIEDVCRNYVRDGQPVVTGIVAVGDSAAATNPSLGRGASIGLLHARALRDTARDVSAGPLELVEAFHAATAAAVIPWVTATTWFDRHRLAEIEADMEERPYTPDDVAWRGATALRVGAQHDPVLARAAGKLAGLIAAPPEVFADEDIQRRLAPYRSHPSYPSEGPTRADLLRVTAASSRS